MPHVGYKLSSAEFGPADLVRHAVRAEAAGFDFALVSGSYVEVTVCGLDPTRHLAAIRRASRAGEDQLARRRAA